MVGTHVPDDEPTWQLILDLKDIVDLVFAPIHCRETIDYIEFKISEHWQRFKGVFPEKVVAKTSFSRALSRNDKKKTLVLWYLYGPWDLRPNIAFFKQIVWHTKNFKNITLTLAKKHQLMVGYHMNIPVSEQSLESRTSLTSPHCLKWRRSTLSYSKVPWGYCCEPYTVLSLMSLTTKRAW